MPPDDEQDLKSAFAELHHRESASAPSFAAMRQRALSAGDDRPSARSSMALLWLVGAPAAVGIALVALWWSNHTSTPTPAKIAQVDSAQRVEQLLTAIEQHFEFDEAISSSVYPTDALLTRTDIDLAP